MVICFKYINIVQNQFPQKAKDFGFPADGFSNGFLFLKHLFSKTTDFPDPAVCDLKTKVKKKFLKFLIFSFLIGPLVIVTFMISTA
jgi:hypothetical protein